MKKKIGIIGDGNVGSALRIGFETAGYDVKAGGRDAVGEVGRFGEVLILAVPFGAVDAVLRSLGDVIRGKILVDATNALTPDYGFAADLSASGAERLQKKAAGATVVKAFNTVFAQHMATGEVKGTTLTAFVAGDAAEAKEQILSMAKDIGFDAVDAGPLHNARWLETLGYLNIQLGYTLKMGTDTGFKYIHDTAGAQKNVDRRRAASTVAGLNAEQLEEVPI
jgi:predicted dinucleotide-binding enzyme